MYGFDLEEPGCICSDFVFPNKVKQKHNDVRMRSKKINLCVADFN